MLQGSRTAASPARSRLAAGEPGSQAAWPAADLTRQPFRPLFVVPRTVFMASGMADGYGNTMQSLIGGMAA